MLAPKRGRGAGLTAQWVKGAITGTVGGLFSGLSGVGGGAVMVPLLTGYMKLNQHRAHGTSLAIIIFVAAAAVLRYWSLGNVDWRLAAILALGSVLGGYVGARIMPAVPAKQLRRLFALFLLTVAVRMLFF